MAVGGGWPRVVERKTSYRVFGEEGRRGMECRCGKTETESKAWRGSSQGHALLQPRQGMSCTNLVSHALTLRSVALSTPLARVCRA